jgi:hypothetical protein
MAFVLVVVVGCGSWPLDTGDPVKFPLFVGNR